MPILFAFASCGQSVNFDITTANRILDSLEAGGDWRKMYVIQTARLNNEREHDATLDSISRVQLAMCDSVVRNGFATHRELEARNQELQRKVSGKNWLALVGVVVGIVIGVIAGG